MGWGRGVLVARYLRSSGILDPFCHFPSLGDCPSPNMAELWKISSSESVEGPWTGGTQGMVERLRLILKTEWINDCKYSCWELPSMPGASSFTQLPESWQLDLYLPGRRQKETSLGNWSEKKNVNALTLRTSQQGSPTQITPNHKVGAPSQHLPLSFWITRVGCTPEESPYMENRDQNKQNSDHKTWRKQTRQGFFFFKIFKRET